MTLLATSARRQFRGPDRDQICSQICFVPPSQIALDQNPNPVAARPSSSPSSDRTFETFVAVPCLKGEPSVRAVMADVEDLDNLEDAEDLDNCLDNENEELHEQIEHIEPKVGMEFDGIDELFEFYKNYAKCIGFPVRKRASRKNVEGNIRSVTFSCSRGGKHGNTSQNPLKPQRSCRIGCTAYLTARLNPYGRWEISVLALDHNHKMSPSENRFFRCNRRISAHVRHQINLNDQAGIRLNKIFGSLVHEAGGYENMSCNQKDNLVEELRCLRLGDGDASVIHRYFSKMVAENSVFFFDIELDADDHLKNIFWTNGRSREAYKEFGDVVTFDTIYLTNKYDMPFAPFVGVNRHGQSILLGCELISKDDTDLFGYSRSGFNG